MAHEYSTYSDLSGHIVGFETTDKQAALKVAANISNQLDQGSVPRFTASDFEDYLHDYAWEVRPGIGDFAVNAILAEKWDLRSLSTDQPTFLVQADTRSVAREFPNYDGVRQLQNALVAATSDLI